MIENLVAYGFSRQGARSVGEILSEVSGLIQRKNNNLSEMTAFIEELKEIKDKVQKREQNFYSRFGASDFQSLNVKLKSIEQAYNPLLANGKIINLIKQNYSFANISKATTEEIASAVEIALENFMTEDMEELLEVAFKTQGYTGKGEEVINQFIQDNFRLEQGSGRVITSRKTSSGKQAVGLGKLIVGYNHKTKSKKGSFIIKTDGVTFSSDFRKRIEDALKILEAKEKIAGQNVFELTREQFRQEVNTLILSSVNNEAKYYLKQVINNVADFDLNRSIASVTGYLGEIRVAALLKHLQIDSDKTPFSIRGTGALRSQQTKQEIPIDLVCAGNGFQVKNYTLDNNSVTFSNSMLTPSWLEGRMRLSGSIYEILISLFGVYQYNQPFHAPLKDRHGNEKPLPEDLPQYIQMYNSINEDGDSLFYQLKPLFDARVPQMLKMYENFSVGGDHTFSVEQVYFNTFYWINSKLVPSSYILEQLIKQLENHAEDVIKTSYVLHQPDSSYTFQHKPKEADKSSMLKAAKKVRVSYDITIDLSNII